jgi:hypothetical protein
MVWLSDGESKMAKKQILYATAEEVATGCYIVYATLEGGVFLYHQGPVRYPYFSKDQADSLVKEINCFKEIDTDYWDDGSFPDMSIRDMEDEYEMRYA